MATARGPRGAPDSGARITKDRVQLPGQGPWPLARMPGSSCRAARHAHAPRRGRGRAMRHAGCASSQAVAAAVITSRLIIRLRESRTHDVLRARPDTEPPAAGNRGLLVSPLVAPRVTEVRAMSRHIPHTTMSKFTLCLRALPVILIFLVLVRARCHGVASRCEHRRKLLREARGVSSGRR